MQEETRLRLLDPQIAQLIRQAYDNEPSLRQFAHECAVFAMQRCGIENAILSKALNRYSNQTEQPLGPNTDELYDQVSQIVAMYDEHAFDIQDAVDKGNADEETYVKAFQIARAVTSVAANLENSAFTSAVDACYEAYHATNDAPTILNIARRNLATST